MARLHAMKAKIRTNLASPEWRDHISEIAEGGMSSTGPLFGMLLLEPVLRMRAAIALGALAHQLFAKHPEQARDIVRRLMWRMSEESGNIGWGVPEALGEVLAQTPALAKDYHSILFTTLLDLGFDDNYCDNDLLRRSCYFAIGRFIEACPEYLPKVRELLLRGLGDTDPVCRGMAAWAMSKFPLDINDTPPLRRVATEGNDALCLITDGDTVREVTASELAEEALRH